MGPNYNYVADAYIHEAESSNISNVFVIGCLEKFNIAIHMQQTRAINLVWALHRKRRLTTRSSVAIVGAGPGGVSAAVLAAMLGARRVTVFEMGDQAFSTIRSGKNRWVHPAYFDLNMLHHSAFYEWAELPFLSWKAGQSSEVARVLDEKFTQYCSYFENLQFRPNHFITGVDPNYDGAFATNPILYFVRREDGAVVADSECFDLNIIATGFGSDAVGKKGTPTYTPDYWTCGSKRSYNAPRKNRGKPRILVSGVGDGGIVEVLNFVIRDFRHENIPKYLPVLNSNLAVKQLFLNHQQLYGDVHKIKESSLHQYVWSAITFEGKMPRTSLEDEKVNQERKLSIEIGRHYREIAKNIAELHPDQVERLQGEIRKDRIVLLNADAPTPYRANSSYVNQIILALLEHLKAFEFIAGRMTLLEGDKKLKVAIGGQKFSVDRIIRRYGPKSEFQTIFSDVSFNRVPEESKLLHESRFGIENVTKLLWKRHRRILLKVESFASIHSWHKTRKNIVTGRRPYLSKLRLDPYLLLIKDGHIEEAAETFLSYIRRSNHHTVISLYCSQDIDLPERRVKAFAKACKQMWTPELTRCIMFEPDTISKNMMWKLRFVLSIPKDFDERIGR